MEISTESITQQLFNLINNEVLHKIEEISKKENLNLDMEYISKTYLENLYLGEYKQVKKRERRLPSKEEQCKGRKNDFTQCTRKRKNGTEFCQSHLKNLRFGRVDDVNEEYVPMWEEEINGVMYLIDNNNLIYTNDHKSPELVGKKDNYGNIDYEELE